jgi:hypothetical protein
MNDKQKESILRLRQDMITSLYGNDTAIVNISDLKELLNLVAEQYKELDSIKNKVHYVKCSICEKEFRAKGKRKYCSDDCKKVAFRQQNNAYFRNMSEEQRAKRREASRLFMRKYRQNKEKENK